MSPPPPRKRISLGRVCVALFVASLTSLLCCYVFFTSEAWTEGFGLLKCYGKETPAWLPPRPLGLPVGFLIEAARSALLIAIAYWLYRGPFKSDYQVFRDVLMRAKPSTVTEAHVHPTGLVKGVLWGLGLLVPIGIVLQHLSLGPQALAKCSTTLGLVGGDEWRNIQLPYLLYMPYSIVNYALIGAPVLTIGVMAVARDWERLRRLTDNIGAELSAAQNANGVRRVFNSFVAICSNSVGRYTAFILGLALAVVFENRLGKFTLTEPGQMWALVAGTLVFFYAVFIGLTTVRYQHTFKLAVVGVGQKGGDVIEFTKDLAPIRFVLHIVQRYWMAAFALLLLGVMEDLLKLVKR